MTDHPITPPPELVQQWLGTYFGTTVTGEVSDVELVIATQAARWGADQELEACCEILRGEFNYHHLAEPLRAARRPRPPSLKEEALNTLDKMSDCMGAGFIPKRSDLDTIANELENIDD